MVSKKAKKKVATLNQAVERRPGDCVWNDHVYSSGGEVESGGNTFVCTNGEWKQIPKPEVTDFGGRRRNTP